MCFCIITDAPRFHSSNTFTARPTYPALKASEARCTLYMVDPYMVDESKPHEPHPVCEMFPEYEDGVEGIAYTIDGVADDFYDDVDFAATTVYFSDVTMEAEGGLHGGGKLTPNAGSTVTKDSSQGGVRGRRSNRRRLAPTTGTSSLLIVYSKPPDASNSKTPAEMADELFGTYVGGSDPVNARSQVLACSRNKLEYIPACDDTSAAGCAAAVADSTIVNGVIEVDITSNISGVASGTVVNWATTAANALLGTHGLSTSSFTQVMHVIPDAASWGGAAAWAYLPGSVSAFRSTYSYRMGVQVHEFGHNIGLHHSGFGTASYADHSCLMGNPSYGDDGPQICWNGAKSWESDWYEEDNITVDAKNGDTFDGLLVGVADWSSQVYIPGEHKVVVEIPNSSGQNLYLMYNRKKGPNEGVTFAADEVTLTYGSASAVSWHEAALNENESHTIANFDGGSNDLVVTVCEKSTTTAGADTVRVLIYADDTNPLSCATTDPPTTSAPTDEPTSVPSLAPSVSPPTTDPPTTDPPTTDPPTTDPPTTDPPTTDPPTTDAPTSTPSMAPSVSPPTTDAPTTDAPTSTPSFVPTRAPSESPTYIPTFSPTAGPTSLPTRAPVFSPSASPSASPTVTPATTFSPTTLGDDLSYLSCGNPGGNRCGGVVSSVALYSENHPFRCCANRRIGNGWIKRDGCNVWAESLQPCEAATHDEASARCEDAGARLCSRDEYEDKCTRGTGCMYDRELNWSSTTPDFSQFTRITFDDFEAPSRWGNFIDGGNHAWLYTKPTVRGGNDDWRNGTGSARLRNKQGGDSSIFTKDLLSQASLFGEIKVKFWAYVFSFERDEDFFLEYTLDGVHWIAAAQYINNVNVANNEPKDFEVVLSDNNGAPPDLSTASVFQIRFRCDASGNGDVVFIDDVEILGRAI